MDYLEEMKAGYGSSPYRAYLSEPITRCPVREKGRIQTLVRKMADQLIQKPFETSLYIPSLVTSPEKRGNLAPEHVYLLDRIRIVQADFMIVIADHTSFGIGGEVEMATQLGKPIVFLSREEKVSRFLIGTPVNALRDSDPPQYTLLYKDWRDLKPRLLPVLETLIERLAVRDLFQLPFWDIGSKIAELRQFRGWSKVELARRTGLHAAQIAFWERGLDDIRRELQQYRFDDDHGLGPIVLSSRQLEQLVNPGMDAIHRMAFVFDVPIHELIGEAGHQGRNLGPAKEHRGILSQIRASRLDSLKARSDQFDVTFREFQKLIPLLVDDVMEELESTSVKPTHAHHFISEEAFTHALRDIRTLR